MIDATNVLSQSNSTGPRRRIGAGSGVPELADSDEEDPAEPESDPVYGGGPGESGLWVVLDKWINALPVGNAGEKSRKDTLRRELEWLAKESGLKGLGVIVYAHCDLLNGNIIVEPKGGDESSILPAPSCGNGELAVTFIDYEYGSHKHGREIMLTVV